MSNYNQCMRCHYQGNCTVYSRENNDLCEQYVKPIDNSKMFARWYKFSGRIGRLEYVLTLIMSVILYFFVVYGVGQVMLSTGSQIETETGMYMFTFGCMIPSVYLAIAAGVKRAHDTRVSTWYSLVPLIPLFFLNVITFVLFCAGCVFLFKDAGEEGVNEYGSNPAQPYSEQISLDGVV